MRPKILHASSMDGKTGSWEAAGGGSLTRRLYMKKILGWIMAGACVLALSGCGGAPADKAQAPAEKVLRVGTEATFPPFESYQKETKTYTGYDVDLIQAVAQNMGYDKVEFVDSNVATIIDDLNNKKFDVAVRCLAMTDDRKGIIDYSDPYLVGGYTVVTKADPSITIDANVLAGKKVAVEKGASASRKLKSMHYTNLDEENTPEDSIKALLDGKVDAAVMSQFVAAFYIANGYGDKIKAAPGPFEGEVVPIAFAVRKDDPNFHARLNAALGEFKRTTNARQLEETYFGEALSRI